MEVWSLVLSGIGVILSIVSIAQSRHYWKRTYKEVKALRDLKASELFKEEYSGTKFLNNCEKLLKENPEAKNPYKLNSNFTESTKACLFNLIQNTMDPVD